MFRRWYSIFDHLRRDSHYSLPRELTTASALSEALEAIRQRWPSGASSADPADSPVFIFSAGWRSGSTLLQRLVVSSNEVHVWGEPFGESAFLPKLASGIAAITRDWPPDTFFSDAGGSNKLASQWIANLTPTIEALHAAHRRFFHEWLAISARDVHHSSRWGLKEVRLTIDHARYLKWLFPNARFLFICRNPVDAYRSWKGNAWYSPWSRYFTHAPIVFARHWRLLTAGFVSDYREVGGMMIRFEDLVSGAVSLESVAGYLDVSTIDASILDRKIGAPKATASTKRNVRCCERWLIHKIIGNRLLSQLQYED